MFSKKSRIKGIKASLWLMFLTILISFLVPSVLAQPDNQSERYESDMASNMDSAFALDMYFAVVNYNEPSNPYILINYYYDNGSYIRMIFGVDRTVFPSLNLDYQNNYIQVFDKKGKLSGYGIRTKTKSNLFVYVSA